MASIRVLLGAFRRGKLGGSADAPGPLRPRRLLLGLVMFSALATPCLADATVIDFEGFSDSTSLTTQIPDLTFTNTTVITAGFTLNEFEFPPRSGVNVVFDDGGPISVVFDSLQASVGGYFTYSVGLTFTAFDAGSNPVGTDASAFSSNLALSGDPGSSPNEFLGVAFPSGIKSITIQGDSAGGSFVLDDLSFAATTSVPEPATLLLVILALVSLGIRNMTKRANQTHHL